MGWEDLMGKGRFSFGQSLKWLQNLQAELLLSQLVVYVALEFDRGLGLSCYLEVYMKLSWCRKRELARHTHYSRESETA